MACDSPIAVPNPKYPWDAGEKTLPVACGKCPPCQKRRINQWVFRLLQEWKVSTTPPLFVTLTYDTKHVPITPNGFMSLRKTDVQKFIMRLRKRQKEAGHTDKVIYYLCGEYGKLKKRPHYHLILFNCIDEHVAKAWTITKLSGPSDYKRHLLGSMDVQPVRSKAAMSYTLKYMAKGSIVPEHRNDDREKEFSLMSKGIGKNYLTDQTIAWHKADLTRNYVKIEDFKVALPRYFRDQIYTEDERKEQNRIISLEIKNQQHDDLVDFLKDRQFKDAYKDYDDWKFSQKKARLAKWRKDGKNRQNE